MSELGFVEAFSIPILKQAIEFLFHQGKRILEERRERRLSGKTNQDNEPKVSFTEELKTKIVISDSIQSKEEAANSKIDKALWTKTEDEVNHLVSLLKIFTKNYYLSKEKSAKWGSTMVPNIIVHELEEAEEQIARTIEQLEKTLSRVYSESSTIYSNIIEESNDNFEKGYLDFAVEGYQAFEMIGETANQLTETTDILGELLLSHTERLNKLSGPGKVSQAHKIAAATARDLTNYASEINKSQLEISNGIPLLNESTSSLILWSRLESGENSTNQESLINYRDSLVDFGESVSRANTNMDKMKFAIMGLANQSISRALTRSCMKVVKSLDNIMDTMGALEDFVQNTNELIDEQIKND